MHISILHQSSSTACESRLLQNISFSPEHIELILRFEVWSLKFEFNSEDEEFSIKNQEYEFDLVDADGIISNLTIKLSKQFTFYKYIIKFSECTLFLFHAPDAWLILRFALCVQIWISNINSLITSSCVCVYWKKELNAMLLNCLNAALWRSWKIKHIVFRSMWKDVVKIIIGQFLVFLFFTFCAFPTSLMRNVHIF